MRDSFFYLMPITTESFLVVIVFVIIIWLQLKLHFLSTINETTRVSFLIMYLAIFMGTLNAGNN